MKSIRTGDRGPAVEDVQRRLRQLGYDIGPTGVDGYFMGRTASALGSFRDALGMGGEPVVDDVTWSALVDATFTLGDRMLYLRLPHFHGNDVRVLQKALNALGFACGQVDGIFGTYCERALGEFQRNVGLVADGIAGDDSVRAIYGLRHIWEGKNARPHSAANAAPARAACVIAQTPFEVAGADETGRDAAERVANLAAATTPEARARLVDVDEPQGPEARFRMVLCGDGTPSAAAGCPVVRVEPEEALAARLLTAFEASRSTGREVVIEVGRLSVDDERMLQRVAVRVLDAVCAVFDGRTVAC